MKRTEQVSVAQLIEELKRFEKDYPDVNVTCCIPDGTICYAVSIDQDGDGQVCIGFEEEEEDSGCLEVEMLIADLEMYDGSAIVRMEACGLSMTFSIFGDGSFFVYDENEECVCCDGVVIGEYEEKESGSGWLTEAENGCWRRRPEKRIARARLNMEPC